MAAPFGDTVHLTLGPQVTVIFAIPKAGLPWELNSKLAGLVLKAIAGGAGGGVGSGNLTLAACVTLNVADFPPTAAPFGVMVIDAFLATPMFFAMVYLKFRAEWSLLPVILGVIQFGIPDSVNPTWLLQTAITVPPSINTLSPIDFEPPAAVKDESLAPEILYLAPYLHNPEPPLDGAGGAGGGFLTTIGAGGGGGGGGGGYVQLPSSPKFVALLSLQTFILLYFGTFISYTHCEDIVADGL
jgi:hypothetical protein